MTTSSKEVPDVKPCKSCVAPDELVGIVSEVRPLEAILRKMAWTLWSATAPNRNQTLPHGTPPYELKAIALLMREQEMRATRLGNVVGEAHQLLEKTLAEASGIACNLATSDCVSCPKLDYLNSKGSVLVELGAKLSTPIKGM